MMGTSPAKSFEQMKAEIAENLYSVLSGITDTELTGDDYLFLLDMEKQHQVSWLLDMFLKLAPDYYMAALQAGNTARGKTASEIEAGLNKRSD